MGSLLRGDVEEELVRLKLGDHISAQNTPPSRSFLCQEFLERSIMEFVFATGDMCTFMSPDTFEQIELTKAVFGAAVAFLQAGMHLPVEFFEGEPLNVIFPEAVEVRVAETAPPAHAQQETTWKDAKLESGLTIRVPMFVGPGEAVRVEVRTGRYLERVRAERKRGA